MVGGTSGGLIGSAVGWLGVGRAGGDAAVGTAGKPAAPSNGWACAPIRGNVVGGLLPGGRREEGLRLPRRVFLGGGPGIMTLVVRFSCGREKSGAVPVGGAGGCAGCWPGRLCYQISPSERSPRDWTKRACKYVFHVIHKRATYQKQRITRLVHNAIGDVKLRVGCRKRTYTS